MEQEAGVTTWQTIALGGMIWCTPGMLWLALMLYLHGDDDAGIH